jgi:hypothetical protein
MIFVLTGILMAICVALFVLRRKARRSRPEDGHDRAERRERDWFGF